MPKCYAIRICSLMALATFFASPSIYAQESKKALEVERHIIFLVDFSASVKENMQNYKDTIELVTGCSEDTNIKDTKICDRIRPRDKITMFKITGKSRRDPDIIGDIYLEEKDWIESPIKYSMMTVPKKRKFRDDIKKGFSNPPAAKNTEIISAIRLAQQTFETVGARTKILIILSDMVEESEFYNFDRVRVDQARILATEEKEGRLPNLRGIKVYVSGARAKNEKEFDLIKSFWLAYFRRTGASFLERDYCSAKLLQFQE